jgi:hypothetical protein
MYSQTLSNFYKNKTLSVEYTNMKPVFQTHSYEIFEFLDKEDITNLSLSNKFFNELCECHLLFTNSVKSLGNLFQKSIDNNNILVTTEVKKSKFKEKFEFNKSMNKFYKGTEVYNNRIQSGRKKKI